MFWRDRPEKERLKHLRKRAAEIREELLISEKMGVYKKIVRATVWMDPDYKEELEEILKLFSEQ